jgi:2-polyprenyl-6-methoxyphenol hydroxylase-like FAD-dependent oxidoreductase
MPTMHTQCCIAGGGPAGMMLGYLLARGGVDVVVLEKHADFLRDFRGDTIHPSTLEVIAELGLLDSFLQRPHQEMQEARIEIGETVLTVADLRHLPTRCKFIALMPQWDFLDFLAEAGRRLPNFHLLMNTRASGLLEEGGCITGLIADGLAGGLEIRAPLVIGADGRHSDVRRLAGLAVEDVGAPIDVLWMRLSRRPGDRDTSLGRLDRGRMIVRLDRGDYWQCAYLIRKGTFAEVKARGLAALRDDIAALDPRFADRVGELTDWEQIKVLTVAIDRLRQWHRPGLLCIGDAAHAMSPIGGIGINLAIQDAVAAANRLVAPLLAGTVSSEDLAAVQARRERPTRLTQRLQVEVQNRLIDPFLGKDEPSRPPWFARLFKLLPVLRRIPARLIGIGFRPEHVTAPELRPVAAKP